MDDLQRGLSEFAKDLERTTVSAYPLCDLCPPHQPKEARFDGKTKFNGSWGYMCKQHFKDFGVGLGLGKGQELLLTKEAEDESFLK